MVVGSPDRSGHRRQVDVDGDAADARLVGIVLAITVEVAEFVAANGASLRPIAKIPAWGDGSLANVNNVEIIRSSWKSLDVARGYNLANDVGSRREAEEIVIARFVDGRRVGIVVLSHGGDVTRQRPLLSRSR